MPEHEEIDVSAEVVEPQDADVQESEVVGRTSKQSPETDAAFAKLRREAEEAKRSLSERDTWVASNFGEQGIRTWEDYRTAVEGSRKQAEQAALARQEQELADKGYNLDEIRTILRTDPEFLHLKRENASLKQRYQDDVMVEQFKELQAEFPDIKEPKDIDDATWAKYKSSNGVLSLTDAYIAAHRKDLLTQARVSGEKSAVARIASKGHLGTEKSAGAADDTLDVEIPPGQLSVWRALGYSDKEARKRARKYAKKGG